LLDDQAQAGEVRAELAAIETGDAP
jgi:hypothetical protein